MKKKILILGGTIHQLNFIKKLIQKNFEIYLVDNIKSSFAKKYSHNFIKLDLRSDKKLRRIILFNNINLISSPSSEYGLISEFKLKNIIKKNSFNIRKIKMISDKYKFNLLKKKLKMNVGLFSLKKLFLKKKIKILVKPRQSSGSKGISLLKSNKNINYEIIKAKNFSYDNKFFFEEFIKGTNFSAQGIVLNKKIVYVFITKQFCDKNFKVIKHLYHKSYKNFIFKKKLCSQIEKIIKFSELSFTFFNCDFVLNKNKIYIVDFSFRLGGNFVDRLIYYANGFDILDTMIKLEEKKFAEIKIKIKKNNSTSINLFSNIQIKKSSFKDRVLELKNFNDSSYTSYAITKKN